jgi:hypothetical protein
MRELSERHRVGICIVRFAGGNPDHLLSIVSRNNPPFNL